MASSSSAMRRSTGAIHRLAQQVGGGPGEPDVAIGIGVEPAEVFEKVREVRLGILVGFESGFGKCRL
jgi:hypothetical protein